MNNQTKTTLTEKEKKELLETTAVIKLETVLQIIKTLDVSSKRGAFLASEMSTVGTLYDMLNNGLNQAFEQKIKDKEKENKSELETIKENSE
jgi:hypothetical protein